MITLLVIYWIATTIVGTYWLIKHPSQRGSSDMEYVTLLDIFAYAFMSMMLAPVFIPIGLLHQIKFKRKDEVSEVGEVFAKQADTTITFKRK